jgi:hypothetical protein
MANPVISCPNCKTEIPLTASLAAPLIKAARREFERKMALKEAEVAEREATIQKRHADLAAEKAEIDERIAEQVEAERKRITVEEAKKAKRILQNDLDQKARELADLQQVIVARDLKLAEAQNAQAELLRKERELDDAKRALNLTVEQRVNESLGAVRYRAKQEADDALRLRVAEKEEQIAAMGRQIEGLKRKAEQGSQQLQGEVQELELEALLRHKFPQDLIEPVPKGEFGGDAIHHVIGPLGQRCGTMLWESKRTRNWSDAWLSKLRNDMRAAKADVALIVSRALPKGVESFDLVGGVWVAEPRCTVPMAIALRHSLIELAAARQAQDGRQTKMEMVYAYLTGPRFRQRIQAIVEQFSEMQDDLARERKAMMRQWAKRDAQMAGVLDATAGLYGDLQGIAGRILPEIAALELPVLEADETGANAAP